MDDIHIIWSYNEHNISRSSLLELTPQDNPKCLIYNHYYEDTDKLERMYFISSLKYGVGRYEMTSVYLYTLTDFDRFMKILNLIWKEDTFTYDREEIESFY